MKNQYTAVFVACKEGGFTGYLVEIPGVVTEGETLDEVRANLHDALALVVAARREASEREDPDAQRAAFLADVDTRVSSDA